MGLHTKLLASAAIALTLVGPAHAQDATGANAATVVATVNGTDITLGELIIARAQLPQQYQSLPDDVLFDGLLDQLIQQQLLADSLTTTPTRVDYALANEERSLKAGEVINDLNQTAVTQEAVETAYAEMFADFDAETEYNASHILVETEEEAATIKLEIEAGADFAQMAMEKSTGPSGPSGGELGWFGAGMMVPAFEEAVMAMEAGDVSDPVQTQFGWHIVTLNETRLKEAPALEEVYRELEAKVQEEAIDARLEDLTNLAIIERPELGDFDPTILQNLDLLEE
ncbi:peptidylprolyl isomerase [Aestuariibius sp. HNIBRBA575]|uniref:peptidylprolyl isomerase n=1 Tax=Aestuariibius sp. HNIBRBA575 TaxID=3233343 RepID=UPI0034A109BF